MLKELYRYVDENSERFVEELRKLLRQPSISAQDKGIKGCAELLRDLMLEAGISTQVLPSEGNPIVFGELNANSASKTLLIYGHYDVQPPEPLEEWMYDPFSATIEDGIIYARGASDDKGNLFTTVKAAEAFLKTAGDTPINLKFIFEGEEEIGSPNLESFVLENKDLLAADAIFVAEGGLDITGRPVVDLGLKGILYIELSGKGANRDLHSSKAPIIVNPAWRLVQALSTMKNPEEKIVIDGFYDHVKPPTMEEIEHLKRIPYDEAKVKEELGLERFLQGVTGLELLKRLLFQPTCNICGFDSGYKESGSKTVLPSKATAKIDFRLVADQKPEDVFAKVKKHLKKHGFDDLDVVMLNKLEPCKTPINAKIAQAVIKATEKVFDTKAIVYPTNPGSGPMYVFKKHLNLRFAETGCAPYFRNTHAPNENMTVAGFLKGIKLSATVINEYA